MLTNNTPEVVSDETKFIIEKVKAWAFPILIAIVAFFAKQISDDVNEMKETQIEIKINQAVIKHDIQDLKNDTNRLQLDVEELKKNLTQ